MNGDTSNSHRKRSQRVTQFITGLLTHNDDATPVVFCQLDCLTKNKNDEVIWQESARWVKYEEDVEKNGKRWSKPHVASVTLHNVFELRAQLNVGALLLDVDVNSVRELSDIIINELSKTSHLNESVRETVRAILLTRHVHPHLKRRHKSRVVAPNIPVKVECAMPKTSSSADFSKVRDRANENTNEETTDNTKTTETSPLVRLNKQFMRKIPQGAEVANVWVGEIEDFKEPITAFIRLTEPRLIGDLTEVPLPTRFIFLHLAPPGVAGHIFEIGRAMSNLMVDDIFSEVAYKATTREDIMHGVDEFLDQVTVLPPGQWDPEIRIEPPTKVPSQERRKSGPESKLAKIPEDDEHGDPTLVRTGRLFGGLVQDIKRKLPHYASDFKDGFHIQCIATILYMYLATLTPNITFGALLGQSTDLYMGTMECIVTVAFVNLTWAFFSGQPLIIMGSTGPVLVLEIILYNICRDNNWEFLPFRLWVGLWSALFLMIIVAFDLSALVRYITRFTEESFACLIAIIFIVESFSKIFSVASTHPFNTNPNVPLDYTCYCVSQNETFFRNMTPISHKATDDVVIPKGFNASLKNLTEVMNFTHINKQSCVRLGGILQGSGCSTPVYYDNVFFLSFILGIGTFTIAWTLINMKTSTFFPTFVRQIFGDFAVFLSICIMVLLDALIGVPTPKLNVPDRIQPSRPDRGWFVNPYSDHNPWWIMIATALPALVAVILIFMDQQITAVIINRKENKLKKGCGYHLDLTICTICIVICSLCGLPWYVAATVRSMAHINSLKMESECTAPGEKPVFLGCREQRLTPVIIAILNGCSVFMTKILQLVPMPVLYGVFLYMGVSALRGMQFMDRMMIMLMPVKYQPDHMYLRHVRTKRVHLFTIIQILCLAVLWVIKAIKTISIVFPIMVLGTCFVRKAMEKIFTMNELKWLDELMPEEKMMKQEDEGELVVEDDEDDDSDDEGPIEFLTLKKFRKIPSSENMPWNMKQDVGQKKNGPGESKFLLEDKVDDSNV